MKKLLYLFFCLCFTVNLFSCRKEPIKVTPVVTPPASPTKGLWMYGSTLSSQDIQTVVNKLADNNVNEVYLLVKGTSGTKTPADKITDFITKAHAKEIKVHLWYTVFQDDAYLATHPAAHVYHSPKPVVNVKPYRNTDSAVNPFYPGYKEYVLDNIKYFLTNFNCDGIHLDYIRYGHLVYSFDHHSLLKASSLGCDTTRLLSFFNTEPNYTNYTSNTGAAFVNLYSNGDTDVVKWVEMRKNIVYEYIKAIKDTIQLVKPGLKLNAAFMPEGATDPNMADVYYAQSYARHSTILDMISPMAYFKDYGQPTSWLQTITQGAISRVNSGCKISAGLQAYDGVTAAQLNEQITYALNGGSYGVIAFRYETITTTDSWNIIKTRFE